MTQARVYVKKQSQSSRILEGAAAYADGMPIKKCPYRPGCPSWVTWRRGWRKARALEDYALLKPVELDQAEAYRLRLERKRRGATHG